MTIRGCIHIILAITVGCTTDFGTRDPDSEEDAPEDLAWDTHVEIPLDPGTDADEGPVEPEEPCGAPTDDCDGDGLAPIGGDCCDFDDRVHPSQDGWFSEPYYCPDESWDYDCSYEVEYEQADLRDGIDATLPEGCDPFNMSTCNDMEGWMGGTPTCGEREHYAICYWSSSPYHSECTERDTPPYGWIGTMRCR